MTSTDTADPQGWRVLGFGKSPEVAAGIERRLRSQGVRARTVALTDDAEGDARLIQELAGGTYDGVSIGGFINGQDPGLPPTQQTTEWFNRILNIIHSHAPAAKLILIRHPQDALPAIERVLGAFEGASQAEGTS